MKLLVHCETTVNTNEAWNWQEPRHRSNRDGSESDALRYTPHLFMRLEAFSVSMWDVVFLVLWLLTVTSCLITGFITGMLSCYIFGANISYSGNLIGHFLVWQKHEEKVRAYVHRLMSRSVGNDLLDQNKDRCPGVSFKQIQRGWDKKTKCKNRRRRRKEAGTRHTGSWQWSDKQSRRHRCLYTQRQMKHIEAEWAITEVRKLTGHGERRQDKTTFTKIKQATKKQTRKSKLWDRKQDMNMCSWNWSNRRDSKRVVSWFILKVFQSTLTSYVTLPALVLIPSRHRDGLSLCD